MLRSLAIAALVLCLSANDSSALPIQFTYNSVGTGSIGETSFSNAAVTITAIGGTSNRTAPSRDVFVFMHSAASVAIEGVGTFSFTSTTETFVNQLSSSIGFSRAQGGDLLDITGGPSAQTWDMMGPVGPLAGGPSIGNSVFLQWTINPPVLTDGGRLIFLGNSGAVGTFQARLIPEPSTYLLGAFALLGLIAFRRRR